MTAVSDREIGEKCGVFGVFGRGLDVARLTYFGLFALQHRGQESSGIATSDGSNIVAHKDMGLVPQVFSEEVIARLRGHIAVGHNRYSTAGGSKVAHAQPILVHNDSVALAHNGNLPSVESLRSFLRDEGVDGSEMSDSRLMAEAIANHMKKGATIEDAIRTTYPLMTGVFSLLVMTKDRLIAVRDRCGVRPLSLARLNGGWVFSSETCALLPIGATYERDVAPGEMVVVSESGVESVTLETADPKLDVFEFVYFARPDSELLGQSVYEVRKRFGATLAREKKIDADVVIPVPETGVPMALGYSQESGIPVEMGITKNRYIHRTFIQPEQHLRDQGVRVKLTPLEPVIRGKRLVVVDDSIVRGTTSRKIVQMLFETGAKEVHFVVSSPPVKFPDFYGIDTPRQSDLIAATKSIEEMRAYLGATSLQFLSYEGMIEAVGVPESHLNTSCFSGRYPIDIKERAKEIRYD